VVTAIPVPDVLFSIFVTFQTKVPSSFLTVFAVFDFAVKALNPATPATDLPPVEI
jgi:hypothetical protein